MKKLRVRSKEEEKKYQEAHESILSVQERCRNMQEIIRFKTQQKDDIEDEEEITEALLMQMEEKYQNYLYEKEE